MSIETKCGKETKAIEPIGFDKIDTVDDLVRALVQLQQQGYGKIPILVQEARSDVKSALTKPEYGVVLQVGLAASHPGLFVKQGGHEPILVGDAVRPAFVIAYV